MKKFAPIFDRLIACLAVAGIFLVAVMLYSFHSSAVEARKDLMTAIKNRPDKFDQSNHEEFVAQLKARGILPQTFPASTTQP